MKIDELVATTLAPWLTCFSAVLSSLGNILYTTVEMLMTMLISSKLLLSFGFLWKWTSNPFQIAPVLNQTALAPQFSWDSCTFDFPLLVNQMSYEAKNWKVYCNQQIFLSSDHCTINEYKALSGTKIAFEKDCFDMGTCRYLVMAVNLL